MLSSRSWTRRHALSQLGPPLRAVDLNSSTEESLQEEDVPDGPSVSKPALPIPPSLQHKENQAPLSLCGTQDSSMCVNVERRPSGVTMETCYTHPSSTVPEPLPPSSSHILYHKAVHTPSMTYPEPHPPLLPPSSHTPSHNAVHTPAVAFPESRPSLPPSSSHAPSHKEVHTPAMTYPESRPPLPPSSSHAPSHKAVHTPAMTYPESRPPLPPSSSRVPHYKEGITPAMTFPESQPPLPPSSILTPHHKVHKTPCPQGVANGSPEKNAVEPNGAPHGSITKYLEPTHKAQPFTSRPPQEGMCPLNNCRDPPIPVRALTFTMEPEESNIIAMRSQDGERRFKKLAMIGQGGSSKVYKVVGEDWQTYALKEVYLKYVDSAVKRAYVNEIRLLSRLKDKPEIITLHDYTWDKQESILYLLLAYAEMDLDALIRQQSRHPLATALYFWNEMLQVVKVIHDEGVIHNDLKPENFVCIGARLKLIDFGIANRIETEKTSIERDIRCGTINYMAPETIETHEDKEYFKVGRPSDIWSLGCILYRMVYGRTPFEHIRNKLKKWHAITDPSVPIAFPEVGNRAARDIMQKCLRRPPKERPTVDQLMAHPFSCLQEMPS